MRLAGVEGYQLFKEVAYRLVTPEFVSAAAEWFFEPRVVDKQVRSWKVAQRKKAAAK